MIFDVAINFWDRGIEIVKRVKTTENSQVPVLVLSSEFLQEKIQQYKNAGADEFLIKPFAKGDLLSVINKIITN